MFISRVPDYLIGCLEHTKFGYTHLTVMVIKVLFIRPFFPTYINDHFSSPFGSVIKYVDDVVICCAASENGDINNLILILECHVNALE